MDAGGVPWLGLQLSLELRQIPLGQLVVGPFRNLTEYPIDLLIEMTSKIPLLLDLLFHAFRDDGPQHANEVPREARDRTYSSVGSIA